YTDEAINEFLLELDKNNLLDNTVIMIYGDHTGVHKFYEDELSSVNLEGDWWKINDNKIPYIIYNKILNEEINSTAGGQVDFLPTISYLLGIDRSDFDNTSMGRILVNTNRNSTILNNGEIIGENISTEEKSHLENTFKIADNIIKGNYFK
uniref:sulfatase-like hydrolase/transferase n=1 Tax=Clostridium sp. TaxID=1506 RepID=UPI00262377A8